VPADAGKPLQSFFYRFWPGAAALCVHMTHRTIREAFRLATVALGALSLLVGSIWLVVLLTARTEHGVVETRTMLEGGETTNVAYVVWGRGVNLRLEPSDHSAPLKAGDSIPVLAYGKGGTVKFGHSFWREWELAGAFAVAGAALVVGGLFVPRHQPTVSRINATRPV
jgi:hypothetical protein